MAKDLEIYDIKIEQMECPLGLDVEAPAFSWKLKSSKQNIKQTGVQIKVTNSATKELCWDSRVLACDCSVGICYGGSPLQPQTAYEVEVEVKDQNGDLAQGKTYFETGMMNPDISAWEGAKWIGAPEHALAAEKLGVFILESGIQVTEGSRAGVVFGANDERLSDIRKNELQVAGENDIRFVLNVESDPACVEIYRRGYCREDHPDVPLYVIPAKDLATGELLITAGNKRNMHTLKIEVVGNGAYTYLDGHKIDEVKQETPFGERIVARQLNPLDLFDTTAYPHLCEIGYVVENGSSAEFDGLRVYDLNKPNALLREIPGKTLTGAAYEVTDPSIHGMPMLRRDFEVKEKPVKARLYATARGIYECSINGKRIDDVLFAPGCSQFDKHLMYQTYDITEYLNDGQNAIGCILGSGWWCDALSFRQDNYNYWGDRPSFLAKIVLTYEDGSTDVIVTNETDWDYFGEGPYRYAGFFNGETYDARLEERYLDFSKPGFDVEGMKKPEIIKPVFQEEKEGIFKGANCWPARNTQEPKLVGNYQAPVREVEVLTAKSMTEPLPGLYIYDLEQEIAGFARLKIKGEKGQRITIRYGEVLYPDLPEYKGLAGQMLQVNLREASNTDVYICKGEGEEIYEPRFTFHGFRYIEVTGVKEPPAVEDVQGVLISSVDKITGEFSCDNALINRFVKNVRYSQFCNFISIPTDCPQRNERMGWMGDTHIFCKTATYQSNVRNFYLRNLQAMKDMQSENGRLPSIAPFGGGFGGQTYESAIVLITWELYQQYGDIVVVRENYEAMDRWMDSMEAVGLPGLPHVHELEWLGDWLAPNPADRYLIYNAFHYRNAVLMQKFAKLLGKTEDVKKYQETASKTQEYWNALFVDPATGKTKNSDGTLCDVQGSYSIGLSCGVFAKEYEKQAYAHLERTTREGGYRIQAGFFGTGSINPMLSAGGYAEAAQKTITETSYPSWLYPVTQGATTIWERWNSYTHENGFGGNNSMNSFNHYSLGSVLSWLYECTLGIQRDEEYTGFKHFTLKPEMGSFAFARGGIDTPYGRINSGWEKNGDGYIYRCTVPENATATLVLGSETKELGSGSYEFEVR